MTRYLLLLLALCSVSFGQSLEGFWAGTLQIEGKTLRAWIEFTKAADGTLTAVAESPDETNEKFPVTTIRQDGRDVMISIAALNGVWEDKFPTADRNWRASGHRKASRIHSISSGASARRRNNHQSARSTS